MKIVVDSVDLQAEARITTTRLGTGSAEGEDYARKQLEQLTQLNAQLEFQLNDLMKRLEIAEQSAQSSKIEAETYLRESGMWQNEARSLEKTLLKEREENGRRHEELEAELESLKDFLDTHDNTDESTIADQVSNINNLVEQLAAELSFRWDIPQEKLSPDLNGDIRRRMGLILGDPLVHVLLTCDIRDDGSPSLLQYGIQTAITAWIFQVFETRLLADGGDQSIRRVTERVRDDEIQPVYGRWRCITQRSLRLVEGPAQEIESLEVFVQETTLDIFYVTGLFGLTVEFDELKTELQARLTEIARKSIRVATIVAEDIVSKDYRLYTPSSTDFNPAWMQTPFPLRSTPSTDKVICTVSPGMLIVAKPGREKVKPQTTLFRKAVVITEATIDEAMKPNVTGQTRL